MLFLKTFKDVKFTVDGSAFQTSITLSTINNSSCFCGILPTSIIFLCRKILELIKYCEMGTWTVKHRSFVSLSGVLTEVQFNSRFAHDADSQIIVYDWRRIETRFPRVKMSCRLQYRLSMIASSSSSSSSTGTINCFVCLSLTVAALVGHRCPSL